MRISHKIVAALLGAAAITAVGCTEDTTVSKRNSAPIGFNVVLDQQKTTRSVSTLTDNVTEPLFQKDFTEFDVWAFKADKDDATMVMGVSEKIGYQISRTSTYGVIDSLKKLNLGIWGYANKYQETLWPSDGTMQLAFYAVSPSSVKRAVKNLTLNMTKATHAFEYTAAEKTVSGSIADGNLVTAHTDQSDFIVAGKTVNLTDINIANNPNVIWMNVPLTFRHALAQVMFEAQLEPGYPDFEVIIHSITICNAYRSGTCTISPTDGSTTWTTSGAKERYAYTVMTGTPGTGIRLYTSNGSDGQVATAVKLSNGTTTETHDNLLLIPQNLTAWNKTGKPDEQENAYLKIRCSIKQHGQDLISEKYVYAPFAGTYGADAADGSYNKGDSWEGAWKAGRCYLYHLQFGLGYDSNGTQNGADITFSVTNTPWVADSSNSIHL